MNTSMRGKEEWGKGAAAADGGFQGAAK